MELIDRLKTIKALDEAKIRTTSEEYDRILDVIGSMPTIEERKKGRWKAYVDYGNHRQLLCSCCGEKGYNTRFCSECGAEMETFTETL